MEALNAPDDSRRVPLYRPPSALTGIPDTAPVVPLPLPPPPPSRPSQDLALDEATHGGRAPGLTWRTFGLVVAVIVVAVPIAYLTFGVLNVDTDKTQARRALQSGAGHTDQITESFVGPNVGGPITTAQNIETARQVIAGYGSNLGGVNARLDSDLAALRAVDDSLKLDMLNPLLWRDKSELADQRGRVEALITGLNSASSGIGIIEAQAAALVALLDVFDSMYTIAPYIARRDANGALTHYSTLDQNMQILIAAIGGAKVSPEFVKSVDDLKVLIGDFKQLLEAVQYRNVGLVDSTLPKVQADITTADNDHILDWNSFERNLLQPYVDRYNSGVKAAGFDHFIAPARLGFSF
jgi:hypothetical protein